MPLYVSKSLPAPDMDEDFVALCGDGVRGKALTFGNQSAIKAGSLPGSSQARPLSIERERSRLSQPPAAQEAP